MGNWHSHHGGREQARIQQVAQESATREKEEANRRAVTEHEAIVDYLRSTLPAHPDFPKKVKSSSENKIPWTNDFAHRVSSFEISFPSSAIRWHLRTS